MKILATICARGGSKGVKNKNIRALNGKPLIAYTIEYLKEWGKAEKIVCSTDSDKIADIAKKYGAQVPFLRPSSLASDASAKFPVLKHAINFCEKYYSEKYDLLIDLDPTSPIRKKTDIENALKKFKKSDADILYSVVKARKNPYFNMVELDENEYAHLSKKPEVAVNRRQNAPEVYDMNASIYFYNRSFLLEPKNIHPLSSKKAAIYQMDEIAAFDIDNEIDFKFIEFLIKNKVVLL